MQIITIKLSKCKHCKFFNKYNEDTEEFYEKPFCSEGAENVTKDDEDSCNKFDFDTDCLESFGDIGIDIETEVFLDE